MQIIKESKQNTPPLYPIEEFCPIEKALYIDIETTGLSKETTSLYLIGCGYYQEGNFITQLFFADDPCEELLLLNHFIDFSKKYTHLFHFNGLKFDIPYLEHKARKYNLGDIFENLTQVDVYQLMKPLRYLLFPSSMRQKCIEDFLGIVRKDMYNGGELISVYHSYVKSKSSEDFDKLITHNVEDVMGMHKIMPIMHFLKLKYCDIHYISYDIKTYTDYEGLCQKEVLFTFSYNLDLPLSFNSKTQTMYLKVNNEKKIMIFRLPIYNCEMKLFFDNYKDYYYMPEKDECIHKSVAMGLDKIRVKKSTKENCYIKRTSDFIKVPDGIYKPLFRPTYKEKARFITFPESFETEKADQFGRDLLDVFFNKRR